MKRITVLFLLASFILTTCGKSPDEITEQSADTITNGAKTSEITPVAPITVFAENEPETDAELTPEAGVLPDNVLSCQFYFDGNVFQLPMRFSELESLGWIADSHTLILRIGNGLELDPSGLLESIPFANGDTVIHADIRNYSKELLPLSECRISNITINSDDLPEDETAVYLPGNLKLGAATVSDALDAYKAPSFTDEEPGITKLTYIGSNTAAWVTLSFDESKSNTLRGVSFDVFGEIEPETLLSDTTFQWNYDKPFYGDIGDITVTSHPYIMEISDKADIAVHNGNAEDNAGWKAAYRERVTTDCWGGGYNMYELYDIDNNGIPELFYGGGMSGIGYKVVTYDNDEVIDLAVEDNGETEIWPAFIRGFWSENMIYAGSVDADMFGNYVFAYKLKNNILTEVFSLSPRDFNGINIGEKLFMYLSERIGGDGYGPTGYMIQIEDIVPSEIDYASVDRAFAEYDVLWALMLKSTLKDTASAPILSFDYGDYNDDGKKEAFAYIGESFDGCELWFVNEKGARKADEIDGTYSYETR